MKKDRLILTALVLAGLFLFSALGADLLHTHADSGHHDDCLACNWLMHAVFVVTLFVSLGEVFRVYARATARARSSRVFRLCLSAHYLRAPPASASL